MPLYQYKCRECGYDLEARQKFSEEPLTECPSCGAPTGLYRVVQAAGVVFKGSGFYVTDSRGNRENLTTSAKKSEKTESTSSSDGGGSSDTSSTKSEGKSESKPDSKPAPQASAD
jgi:putative FmdB family regulatory protein